MRLSRAARKTSKQLFQSTLRDGQVDAEAVRRVVGLVSARRPRHFLQILKDFKRRVRLELARSECTVDSAVPVDDGTRKKITDELHQRHGAGITPEFRVAPELLGGLRIRLGSDVWDGSVRARLARLADKL